VLVIVVLVGVVAYAVSATPLAHALDNVRAIVGGALSILAWAIVRDPLEGNSVALGVRLTFTPGRPRGQANDASVVALWLLSAISFTDVLAHVLRK
jgi:hypothetical protein